MIHTLHHQAVALDGMLPLVWDYSDRWPFQLSGCLATVGNGERLKVEGRKF